MNIKGLRYYFLAIGSGFFLNMFLLILVIVVFNFHYKSAFSLLYIGIPSYLIKSFAFYIPVLGTFKLKKRIYLLVVCLSPFLIHFLWYLVLIAFQLDTFYYEFSYGYIQRFPHYLLQLFTTLIVCITVFFLGKRSKGNHSGIKS